MSIQSSNLPGSNSTYNVAASQWNSRPNGQLGGGSGSGPSGKSGALCTATTQKKGIAVTIIDTTDNL